MANVFLDLPVPTEPGVGASVDCAALGADRTITAATLVNVASLAIEVSNDDAEWTALTSFGSGGGARSIRFAARYMRVRLINKLNTVDPASGNCDVGGDNAAPTIVVAVTVPNTDGATGASVDITTLGIIKTALVTGVGVAPYPSFNGSVVLEISQDGTDWTGQYSVASPGGIQTREFTAQFIRARRILKTNAPAGTVNCTLAGAPVAGAGGGGGLSPGGTLDEPQFTDGPTAVATSPTVLSGPQDPVLAPGLAAPQGTVYLNDNGAIYFKTGAADTDWESLSNDSFYNVRDFGAVGDGVTDDRPAIQAAIDAANAAGGGTVFVPNSANPYICTRASVGVFYTLLLKSNVRLLGESINGAIIQMEPGVAASVRLIYTEASATRWGLDTLTLDGDKANQSVNEQRHGIFINTSSTDGYIVNCRWQNHTGDGIYHYQNVARVITQRCYFTSNDRNSLTFGDNNSDCSVLDCTFNDVAVQHIDSEPKTEVNAATGTPGDRASGILIQGNTFYTPGSSYAITTAGPSIRFRNERWKIIGNNFYDASLEVIWIDDVTIQGNNWFLTPAYTTPGLEMFRYSDRVTVQGNTFTTEQSGSGAAMSIVGANDLDQAQRTTIQGNTFNGNNVGSLLNIQGARDVIVDGNQFNFVGDDANSGNGVNVRATLNVGSVHVSNNIFRRCAQAIRMDSTSQDFFQRISIDGNAIFADGVQGARGIELDQFAAVADDVHIGTNYFAPDFSFDVDSVNPTAGGPFVTSSSDWNPATDQITIAGHGLTTEDGPFYMRTDGALPAGDGFDYRSTANFVIVDDPNTIRLAASRANAAAGTAKNFTTPGSGNHTLTSAGSLLHDFGGIGRDYLNQTGPFRLTTTGTLPAGLALATDYYWIRVGGEDAEFQLAATFDDAYVYEPTPVVITDAGTGTHTVTLSGINAAAEQIDAGPQNLWAIIGSAQVNQGYPGLHTGLGAPTHAAADGTIYMRRDGAAGTTLYAREGGSWQPVPTAGGGGAVSGPVSSTDNALARWDGASGAILQDSDVSLDAGDFARAGNMKLTPNGVSHTFSNTSVIFGTRIYPLLSNADLGVEGVLWRGSYFNGQEKRGASAEAGDSVTTNTSVACLVYTGTGGDTFTLWEAGALTRFRFVHAGSGTLNVATSGGDTLDAVTGASATMAAGETQLLQKLGTVWYRIGS